MNSLDEYVSLLVNQEWEDRQQRKIENMIRQTKFRFQTSAGNIDYTGNQDLDKNQFEHLLSLNFIKCQQIIIGPIGVGKSYPNASHRISCLYNAQQDTLFQYCKADGVTQTCHVGLSKYLKLFNELHYWYWMILVYTILTIMDNRRLWILLKLDMIEHPQ